jgi:hypothetical protein
MYMIILQQKELNKRNRLATGEKGRNFTAVSIE